MIYIGQLWSEGCITKKMCLVCLVELFCSLDLHNYPTNQLTNSLPQTPLLTSSILVEKQAGYHKAESPLASSSPIKSTFQVLRDFLVGCCCPPPLDESIQRGKSNIIKARATIKSFPSDRDRFLGSMGIFDFDV